MLQEIINIKSSEKDLRNFGYLVGGVFLLLGLYISHRGSSGLWRVFIPLGIFLIASGYFFAHMLKPAQKIWMALAVILGWIVTRVLLSVFFFLCIVPISFIAKIFGKRFLDEDFRSGAPSYWKKRAETSRTAAHLEKQF